MSWAFATSPYGLGLSIEQSWSLTPREFAALSSVRDAAMKERLTMWALERADFRNAHFVHKDQPIPWTVEGILNPETRLKRSMEHRMSEQRVMGAQAQLAKMKPGEAHPLARKWSDEDLKKVDWSKFQRRAN